MTSDSRRGGALCLRASLRLLVASLRSRAVVAHASAAHNAATCASDGAPSICEAPIASPSSTGARHVRPRSAVAV